MKKILIITFEGQAEMVVRTLKAKNPDVFKKLTVLSSGDQFHKWIGKERPETIVFDNRLSEKDLQLIYLLVRQALGVYDVPCSLFLFDSPVKLPGVINVKMIEDAIAF